MNFIRIGCIVCLSFISAVSFSQQQPWNKPDKSLLKKIDQHFKEAVAQYKFLQTNLPEGKFPKTYFPSTGNYEFSNSSWWCSGFYPGSLLYLFQETKEAALYIEANRMLELLKKEQYNKGTHDLGFMMYCSFGNALKFNKSAGYDTILLNSAKSLASRFDPKVGCIKSWDRKSDEYLVIIDNMMNLKLLFWATQATGDSSFYKIAVTHANTTMQHHFRADNSTYHVVNYNSSTGAVQEKKTVQGFANESAWARGQAWGLYGYTEVYRETKNKKYLEQANKIARFILGHPNLPADKIPYWDFNAPDIPTALRDASAAAIMASALLELAEYVPRKLSVQYYKAATTILHNLSEEKYCASAGTNGGFILKHSVGNFPRKTEVDVPLTYADYYFLEAMLRYKYKSQAGSLLSN